MRNILKKVIGRLKSSKFFAGLLDNEEHKKNHVIDTYRLSHGLPTIDLLELFPVFEETVEPYCFLEGSSSPLDIGILKSMARKYNPCSYLEIGTWRGESMANVAGVADRCVSISLSNRELMEMGYGEPFIKNNFLFSNGIGNVTHIAHNSHTFDFSTLGERFDIIFIDGDHRYEGVKIDTMNAFKLLRNERSVIIWHDYGTSPEQVRWSVLAGILDGCPEGKRDHLYHISNSLCAIYIMGEFKTDYQQFPEIPNKTFRVRISLGEKELREP
jgi:hypothetical protein